MQTWTDETTGRQVRQLTSLPEGALVPYFRQPRYLPDGRVLAHGKHDAGTWLCVDCDSGDWQPLPEGPGNLLRFRERDGLAWFYDAEKRELWSRQWPDGEAELVGTGGENLPDGVSDITCDGRTLIGATCECEPSDIQGLFEGDYRDFWRWIYRKRSAVIWTHDLVTGTHTEVVQMPRYNPQHIDSSPVDPGLFKYAQDGLAVFDQRIHAVRIDGSEWRPIRPQAPGEWIHHEFWWPGGELIGYKHVDRRDDPTIHVLPWGEYAPGPLRLGIANLAGEEVYFSDPLGHFHSHLNVARNAQFVTGEGTHDYSFACVAAFDFASTRIRMEPVATIHTPYIPSGGQNVETGVTPDARWVVFNDTQEGVLQVCAVRLEL